MAQLNWTYYSLSGMPYRFDMYHGEDSGHLIFMVNGEIMMIDFNIKTEKTHNFFIENQLIEFAIKSKKEGFDYILTPQMPKKQGPEEKIFTKHFWIPLILIIIAVNLILLFVNNN